MADGDAKIGTTSAQTAGTRQQHYRPEWACRAARIASDYRSRDVVVLDLTAVTPVVDYFVIASGTSPRQMQALADEISRVFKAGGDGRRGIEGHDTGSTWILIDFGDIVVHVQSAEARELYDLESLWADAARVDWEDSTPGEKERGSH